MDMLCDFIDMIHSADRILDIQTERVTESRPEAARVGEGQDGARDARGTSGVTEFVLSMVSTLITRHTLDARSLSHVNYISIHQGVNTALGKILVCLFYFILFFYS